MPPRRPDFAPEPLATRWERKVERLEGGCWNWTGALDNNGYGKIQEGGVGHRKVLYAHRVSWEMHRGPIPAGLTIDHLCRNRRCVNPTHLEPVTNWENIQRTDSWTAQRSRSTHCVNGHTFTPKNTRMSGPGRRWRKCIACEQANNVARRRTA